MVAGTQFSPISVPTTDPCVASTVISEFSPAAFQGGTTGCSRRGKAGTFWTSHRALLILLWYNGSQHDQPKLPRLLGQPFLLKSGLVLVKACLPFKTTLTSSVEKLKLVFSPPHYEKTGDLSLSATLGTVQQPRR